MKMIEDISLASYTTLQVGGPAKYFAEVTTNQDLEQARQFAEQTAVPVLILGEGSNILIRDEGFEGLVILNKISGISIADHDADHVLLTVGAGELLDDVTSYTIENGLWGLENLSHIPGTVGAAPIQNVGAYGVEVSSLIYEVHAYSFSMGEHKIFTNRECQFAYRDSFFKTQAGRDFCITQVAFRLCKKPSPVLHYGDLSNLDGMQVSVSDIRNEVIRIRSTKFPDWHSIGTAGSFFKNPIISADQASQLRTTHPALPVYEQADGRCKVSLGWILDKVCNLRGYQKGDVALYKNQALVLINTGDSAAAIEEFSAYVTQLVQEKVGITIEPEVRFV